MELKTKYKYMYMKMAYACAEASEASRLKVGCVIVTKDGMVATGLNGTPEGWHTNTCEGEDGLTLPIVRHAERQALDKMLKEGVSCKDAIAFITHQPCIDCAVALDGAGVKEVYYSEEYRCKKGIDFLAKRGILVEKLEITYEN